MRKRAKRILFALRKGFGLQLPVERRGRADVNLFPFVSAHFLLATAAVRDSPHPGFCEMKFVCLMQWPDWLLGQPFLATITLVIPLDDYQRHCALLARA